MIVLVLLLAVVLPAEAREPEASPAPASVCRIAVVAGRVSANVRATPAREVAAHLARAAGVGLEWLEQPGDEPVTASFTSLHLDEALARLLPGRNHALVAAAPGAAGGRTLWIGSRRNAAFSPLPRPVPAPVVPAAAAPMPDLDAVAAAVNDAPTGEAAGAALATLEAHVQKPRTLLAAVALGQGPASLRGAAAQLLRNLGDRRGDTALARLAAEPPADAPPEPGGPQP